MEALMKRRGRRAGTRGWRGGMLGAVVALACLALGGAAAAAPDSLDTLMREFGVGPLSGDPSPVALPDLAGQLVTLEGQRGQVVMLYFWATW